MTRLLVWFASLWGLRAHCRQCGRRTAEPHGADVPLCRVCWRAVWPERNSP